jgi:hypothetical protein
VRAIRAIRGRCDTPVIAVSIFPDEGSLVESGVGCVVRLPFESEKPESELRRVLRMADQVKESKPGRLSLNELVVRRFGTALLQAIKNGGSVS